MPLTSPPTPITKEEIEKRIKAGAKTLEEIDPEFCKWYRRQQDLKIIAYAIIVGIFMALVYYCFSSIL